jgi:hypothetical protein
MVECRHCHRLFREDPADLGARCPSCRQPLYERAEGARPPLTVGLQQCTMHPTRPAVGTCRHCRTPICSVCRTRWQEHLICLTCAERSIAHQATSADHAQAHRRLALRSLCCAVIGWLLLLLGLAPLVLMRGLSKEMAILAIIVLLVSAVPALIAAGQGTAALRLRGQRLRMATAGLVLAGGQLGLMLGVLLVTIWAS